MTVKKGLTFEHLSFLDPRFQPGPGQTYANGPKATMVVTHVAGGRVWYGYADMVPAKGMWVLDIDVFTDRYTVRTPQ